MAPQPSSPQLVGYSHKASSLGFGNSPTVRYCVSITTSAGFRPMPEVWPNPAALYNCSSSSGTKPCHGFMKPPQSFRKSLKVETDNFFVLVQGTRLALEYIFAVIDDVHPLSRRHNEPKVLLND